MVKIRRESSTTTTNNTTTATTPYNITTIINLDSPDSPSVAGGATTSNTTTTTAPSSSSGFTSTAMRLPLHASLPDGTRVTVNVVTGPHVAEVYNMIQDAALHGDGYGVDEFPTEKDFLQEVQGGNGKVFRICDAGGKTIAAFVVLDSKYFRGQGTVADCYVIVKREERRKGLGDFCMQMVLQFAGRMGYVGIYADTFQDNVAMRRILELSGFQRVGALPMSGKMPDGSVKPSVIYYCQLGPLPPPVSHQSHIGERPNPNLQEISNGTDSDTSPF